MSFALPVDAEDVLDALFLSIMTLVGFLGGGLIGLVIGFAAGYAYITWTDRIADLERTVNALTKEKEALRRRVDELEVDGSRGDGVTDGGRDDGVTDGGRGDGVTDGGRGNGAVDTTRGDDTRSTENRSR